jgi:FkbM family methyltransferase
LIGMLESRSLTAKLLRLPRRLVRPGMSLPVLSGPLRGAQWIVDSGERGYWLGTHQKEKQALFAKTVSPGEVVFDIGGRVGFFALLAARLAGPRGQVFVFEPQPRNVDYLRRHLELNKARNVTVVEAAVSYKSGAPAEAAVPPREAGRFPGSAPAGAQTWALDSLLERGQVPLPDLIHMDIGGGEFAALCGARTLLSRAHPTILLSTHGEIPHRECCALLEMLDYRLAPFDGQALEESREILATHI